MRASVRHAAMLFALGGLALPASAASAFGAADPFGANSKVAPAPNLRWEPFAPLPRAPAPASTGQKPATTPLSLPELTEFALRNNPRTRQAWFAARAAAAGVGIEQADMLPQIAGLFSVSHSQQVSATSGDVVPAQNRYGPSVSLSYILFDFGARSNQIEAAEYRLLAANLTQNRVLQDVVFQVERAYYLLLGLEALIRTNEQSLKNSSIVLEAGQKRRESGVATVADVYRAETAVALAQLVLTRSRGDFEKARGQLATAVGLPVDAGLTVQTLLTPPPVQEVGDTLGNLLERAKAGRPDLIAAEAQVRAARASAAAAAKAGLPSIEIIGGAGRTRYTDGRQPADNYSLGLNLRIPIFTGYRDTYSIRQAEAQAAQAEATRDVLFQQTELDVWQAYYDLQTAASAISSTDALVKSAEQTAQATLARYQSGFGSILDLITAQQDESNARVQRIQSYLDWYTALARLNFSIGMNDILVATGEKK